MGGELGGTSKERFSISTISPNQRKAALMNSSTAKKAMRLAAMLATSPTEAAAPLLAASRMFRSSLGGKKPCQDHVAEHLLCKASLTLQTSLQGLPDLCHLQCPNSTHSCPMPSFCSHSPTGDANTFFALELGLFHFGVDQFGHGKGTRCSHHRGCDQRCCIYLQQADCGLRPWMRLPRVPKHVASNAWSNPGCSARLEWEDVPIFPILATEDV